MGDVDSIHGALPPPVVANGGSDCKGGGGGRRRRKAWRPNNATTCNDLNGQRAVLI